MVGAGLGRGLVEHATSEVGYTVTGESASTANTLQRVVYLVA